MPRFGWRFVAQDYAINLIKAFFEFPTPSGETEPQRGGVPHPQGPKNSENFFSSFSHFFVRCDRGMPELLEKRIFSLSFLFQLVFLKIFLNSIYQLYYYKIIFSDILKLNKIIEIFLILPLPSCQVVALIQNWLQNEKVLSLNYQKFISQQYYQ